MDDVVGMKRRNIHDLLETIPVGWKSRRELAPYLLLHCCIAFRSCGMVYHGTYGRYLCLPKLPSTIRAVCLDRAMD
jgi:hypothetical protein